MAVSSSFIGDCGDAKDVEILRGLRQAAQRHDLEILYQAVPRLGVVGERKA